MARKVFDSQNEKAQGATVYNISEKLDKNGNSYAVFNIAYNSSWKNKAGEYVDEKPFYANGIAYKEAAAEILKINETGKSSFARLDGSLYTEKFTKKDGAEQFCVKMEVFKVVIIPKKAEAMDTQTAEDMPDSMPQDPNPYEND